MRDFLDEVFLRINKVNLNMTFISKLLGLPYVVCKKYFVDKVYDNMQISTFLKIYALYKTLEEPTRNLEELEASYKLMATSIDFPFSKLDFPDKNLSRIDPFLYEILCLVMKIGANSENGTGTLMSVRDHLLSGLNDEERFVIMKRINICPRTFEEIGKEINLTRQRVQQVYDKAIKKLKSNPDLILFITSQDALRRELDETKHALNKICTETGSKNLIENKFPIGALGIDDKRLKTYLVENKVFTVGDLLTHHSVMKMKDTKNIGESTIEKLQHLLRAKGFRELREF